MGPDESDEDRERLRERDSLVNLWLDAHYFDSINDPEEREAMLRAANEYADREISRRDR